MDTPTSSVAVMTLAVLQGLAEFLPISSSGHLVVARSVMGLSEAGLVLDVALHVGTLLAVLWAYRRDVGQILVGITRGEFGLALWLIVATIPIGVVGVLAKDWLERAFTSSDVAGIGLLFTAVVLLVGESARRRNARVSAPADDALPSTHRLSDALFIGFAQVLALVPGVSRSGVTIGAGLLRGHSGMQAARYSFLMSLPAVAGAAIVSLPDALEEGIVGLSGAQVGVAMLVAAVTGWAALRTLLLTIKKGAFRWFALYCALLGVCVLALL